MSVVFTDQQAPTPAYQNYYPMAQAPRAPYQATPTAPNPAMASQGQAKTPTPAVSSPYGPPSSTGYPSSSGYDDSSYLGQSRYGENKIGGSQPGANGLGATQQPSHQQQGGYTNTLGGSAGGNGGYGNFLGGMSQTPPTTAGSRSVGEDSNDPYKASIGGGSLGSAGLNRAGSAAGGANGQQGQGQQGNPQGQQPQQSGSFPQQSYGYGGYQQHPQQQSNDWASYAQYGNRAGSGQGGYWQ